MRDFPTDDKKKMEESRAVRGRKGGMEGWRDGGKEGRREGRLKECCKIGKKKYI